MPAVSLACPTHTHTRARTLYLSLSLFLSYVNQTDNGGILNAYNAYTAHAGNATDYPLFFVSYAQGWCSKANPEYQKLAVLTDVHSPPRFRVLGPLMNLDYFSQVFSCPAGSTMNPTTKCKVW
jgi:predicted metalloendopeptidase